MPTFLFPLVPVVLQLSLLLPVLTNFCIKWNAATFRFCRGKKCLNVPFETPFGTQVQPLSPPSDKRETDWFLFLQKQTWAIQISGLLAVPHSSFLFPFQMTLPAILHQDISTCSCSAQPFLCLTFVMYSSFLFLCIVVSPALHQYFIYTLPPCCFLL